MNIRKITILYFVTLAIVCSIFFLGLRFYTDYRMYSKVLIEQNEIKKYEKKILSDLNTLNRYPVFKEINFKNNAAQYIESEFELHKKSNLIITDLFNKFPDWLFDKTDFNGLIADSRYADLDAKWLEKLNAFDHWIQDQPQDYILLKNWAVVYAIKKLQNKDLRSGLKIYRKVSELIQSSGLLPAQFNALAMIKSEHKLMNDFQAQNWQLIPMPSIDSYKRLTTAWLYLLQEPFFNLTQMKLEAFMSPRFALCGAIIENQSLIDEIQTTLKPQFTFEMNLTSEISRLENFNGNVFAICRINKSNSIKKIEPHFQMNQLPYFRRITGLQNLLVRSVNLKKLISEVYSDNKK